MAAIRSGGFLKYFKLECSLPMSSRMTLDSVTTAMALAC